MYSGLLQARIGDPTVVQVKITSSPGHGCRSSDKGELRTVVIDDVAAEGISQTIQ